MEVRSGYKQTEVGMIPEDWEVEAFGALAHIERGKFTARPRNDPKYYGGEIPFIQTGDVRNSSGWIKAYSQTLNQEGLKVSKLFPRGTLFFTIAANIGDVGFAGFDTACPDSLVAITPVRRVDGRWLAHELGMRKPLFEKLASHNAQLNINLEKLRPYLLPVPPPAEQEAIAEALSDADALIESLEQLLAKKRQLKQGAMQELLTGKKRLPGFETKPGHKQTEVGAIPEDWEICTLGTHATFKTGPFGSALHQSDYVDGGVPVINPMQLVDGKIQPTPSMAITEQAARKLSEFRLSAGNVVIGRRGEMGRCAFVRIEEHGWLCGTGSMIIRTGPSLDARFIQRVLSSPPSIAEIENASVGSTMINLNQSTLGNLLVPLPRTKAEQEAIAQILSDMDAEIAALDAKLAKARNIKQGMMQELLTGRIRLV